MVRGKITSIIDNGVPASKKVLDGIAKRRIKEEAERIDLAKKTEKLGKERKTR